MLPAAQVGAAVNYNRLIDDTVFSNSGKMNASQIDSFLNSFPSSCISSSNGFKTAEPIGYTPSGGFKFGGNVTAGQAIYVASKAYGLNPQVLLATLQKEQSLVSGGAGCHPNTPNPSSTFTCDLYGNGDTYNCTNACPYSGGCVPIAVGYGCPGRCNADQEGFSQQIIRAAWFFKFGQQRSLGNVTWNVQLSNFPHGGNVWDNSNDPPYCRRDVPMTQGKRIQCQGDTLISYDGLRTIDGSSLHMDTGGTAALYWYTPHKSGNANFVNIFSGWFGNPSADTSKDKAIAADWDSSNESGTGVKRGNTYFLDNNNDGVANTVVGWGRATDKPIIGDWDGDGVDEMGLRRGNQYFLDYDNNGRPNSIITYGKSTDDLVVGDWDGDGIDELGVKRGATYYLDYDNNGKADKKVSWGRASDAAFCGDWDGDGADELALRRGTDYFLDFDNNGRPNAVISWGRSTDKLIYGDWDDDGADEIGLRRANSYILDFDNNGSPNKAFVFGKASDASMVGDWDGDGADEIGLKRMSNFYLDDNLDGNPETGFVYTY
jgi:hypothetical protein